MDRDAAQTTVKWSITLACKEQEMQGKRPLVKAGESKQVSESSHLFFRVKGQIHMYKQS